jgi:hypothetical protein
MEDFLERHGFRRILSLEPLIQEWKRLQQPSEGLGRERFEKLEQRLDQAPELSRPIEDMSVLEKHRDLVKDLMSIVIPNFFWETEAIAAAAPLSFRPFIVSPQFQDLLCDGRQDVLAKPYPDEDTFAGAFLMNTYSLILKQCFGVREDSRFALTVVVEEKESHLERYFRLHSNFRFVRLSAPTAGNTFSDKHMEVIREHASNPDVLQEFLPAQNFELCGFGIFHAVDVTESELLSLLERALIDKESVLSQDGFLRIQQRLRALFRKPDLTFSLLALEKDKLVPFNSGLEMYGGGDSEQSRAVSIGRMGGSVYDRAVDSGHVSAVGDLSTVDHISGRERYLLQTGMRSMVVAPLTNHGQVIGALELCSTTPEDFGLSSSIVIEQIKPFFSLALDRMFDEIENRIQVIIKEKCTAVHPSVEWRFRRAAVSFLHKSERDRAGDPEPIVFKNVYSLYGASDIRGSSRARKDAIEGDLAEHLSLAHNVLDTAIKDHSSPILEELAHRILTYRDKVTIGLGSGEETEVMSFLTKEVEPVFSLARRFGPHTELAVKTYEETLDPERHAVFRRRSDFEESVATFNTTISNYLDGEQFVAQSAFPHYFDKHKTDGLDYTIYVGESMVEHEDFIDLHVRYLRLWQLIVACGIGWHTEQLKSSLRTKLEVTHLILVNHKQVAIRFRFDEKRFDVDGPQNTGNEIIRSRIDKATVKDGTERLTQPGKIAIVYSRQEEEEEICRHLCFLRDKGYIRGEDECLELDHLPDVQGLKAIRVEINFESEVLADRARRTCQKAVRRQTTRKKIFEPFMDGSSTNHGSVNRFQGNRASLRTVMASFT